MATNTTSTLSANLPSEFYKKTLLTVMDETLQFVPLGVKTNLPSGSGKVVKWLVYDKLSAATSGLTEGVVPSDTSLTTRNVTATVAQYGGFAKISDFLEATAIDPVAESAMERLGKQAALTLDTLVRDVLDTALPNQFANGKASLAATGSTDVLTAKEFLKAVVTLKKNNVGPASGNNYIAVCHPACLGDVMNDTNIGSWVDINKYTQSDSNKIFNGEVGKVYMTRILESANVSSTTTGTLGSATVYSNVFLGEEAFGVVALNGKNIQTFTKPAGSAGSLDPLNQVGTVGWKSLGFVAKYLAPFGGSHPDRGLRIRAGSSF